MAENSKIEWTDHTFNPWRGCTRVSPACKNCYAMDLVNRFGGDFLGRRVVAAEKYWRDPLKWNREAERLGLRKRVFCASLADVFEDWNGHIHDSKGQVVWNECAGVTLDMQEVRDRLFDLIDETPNLDWLLLTKRPENILGMWPKMYSPGKVHMRHRKNVWLGTTVENQEQAGKRIPELLNCRELSPVLFLSCEPLLGPVDISKYTWPLCWYWKAGTKDPRSMNEGERTAARSRGDCWQQPQSLVSANSSFIDWVIAGGESGRNARPMHPDWARSMRDQCNEASVPFFFKQWGEWAPATRDYGIVGHVMPDSGITSDGTKACWIGWDGELKFPSAHHLVDPIMAIAKVGKKRAGRLLDGREWSQFPLVKE